MHDYLKPEHADYTPPTQKEVDAMSRDELIDCLFDLKNKLSETGLTAMRRIMNEIVNQEVTA